MTLEDLFHLTAILFFFSFFGAVIYIIYLITKLKNSVEEISTKAKDTAQTLALTGNTLKAGALKMFLNLISGRKYYE